MHLSLLALLALALVGIPNLATATQTSFKEVICKRHPLVSFKKVFGAKYVTFMKFRRIGDNCVKVLANESNREDSYVTQDCQRCKRSPGTDDKSWQCERVPEAELPEGKRNCRMTLGSDCKWYLVSKNDDSRACA